MEKRCAKKVQISDERIPFRLKYLLEIIILHLDCGDKVQVSAGNIFCLDDNSEITVQLSAIHAHMTTSMCSIVIGYTYMTICMCIYAC